MASFKYLWTNRAKFPLSSARFYRAWAKRLLLVRSLVRRNRMRNRLVGAGANISSCAELGKAIVHGDKRKLRIGAFSYVGVVELALHDCITIGERVCINDGCHILTGSHDVHDPEWRHVKAPIIIEDFAWICTGAIILPGVRIGRGAVVGAGAVVTKSVAEYNIVVGNPASIISKKRTLNLNYNPCGFLAANNAWLHG